MYRAINPLDSKTYYINYSFSIKDTIYEVGYSYLKFREIIHDTCKILFILILVIAFIVIIVFPYFFNEGLLRPLNTLLTGVKEVNEGKLDTEVPILVRDEIGILSESFNHMVSSMSEAREKLNNAFSQQIALTEAYERFVPKEFLDFLMKESVVNIKLGDHIQKRMTILFSDIRSFTNISEKMTPQENFNFINSYFKKVGPVISKNSGFIDKYIGDSIMALFPKSPQNALNAAIETQDEIKSYNRYAYKENLPPIDAGIGIHTGELMLGTVGEDKRMEGTVISDAVNLAARMEKLSKIYDAKIILSSDTFSSLDDTSNYNYRYLDKVQVKGKDDFVDIYEFFDGDRENIIEDKLATKEKFEEGVSLFQKGEQGLALKLFEQVSLENKKDVAAQLYIERCKSKKVIK